EGVDGRRPVLGEARAHPAVELAVRAGRRGDGLADLLGGRRAWLGEAHGRRRTNDGDEAQSSGKPQRPNNSTRGAGRPTHAVSIARSPGGDHLDVGRLPVMSASTARRSASVSTPIVDVTVSTTTTSIPFSRKRSCSSFSVSSSGEGGRWWKASSAALR